MDALEIPDHSQSSLHLSKDRVGESRELDRIEELRELDEKLEFEWNARSIEDKNEEKFDADLLKLLSKVKLM